jgi:hypothetical protein
MEGSTMPSHPPKPAEEGLLEVIVRKASRCRLEAMNCTGDRKWMLLAMAEELEEIDHDIRAPACRRLGTAVEN